MTASVSFSPSPQRRPHAPVDLVHLARQTAGDPVLEREVLMLFRCQSRKTAARLKASLDAAERMEAAHLLKGSARGVGAWAVAQAAETFEACRGEGPQGREALAIIEAAIAEADAFIAGIVAR
jgi:HPt (histidine-containing phosphotransfer) domain-containing protein